MDKKGSHKAHKRKPWTAGAAAARSSGREERHVNDDDDDDADVSAGGMQQALIEKAAKNCEKRVVEMMRVCVEKPAWACKEIQSAATTTETDQVQVQSH